MDINITEASGYNGPYKQAIAKFRDTKKPTGCITVAMPKPVSLLSDEIIKQMKNRVKQGNNPRFIVDSITSRERADGKGSYDITNFRWV